MNARPHDLATVLLGVAGIWFIAGAITGMAFVVSVVFEASPAREFLGRSAFLAASLCHVLLRVAVGLVLLFGRQSIAARFFSEGGAEGAASGPIQAAAFAVVGVALFSDGFATVVERLEFLGTSASGNALLVGAITKAALGVALFFGADRLTTFWHRNCVTHAVKPNSPVQTDRATHGG